MRPDTRDIDIHGQSRWSFPAGCRRNYAEGADCCRSARPGSLGSRHFLSLLSLDPCAFFSQFICADGCTPMPLLARECLIHQIIICLSWIWKTSWWGLDPRHGLLTQESCFVFFFFFFYIFAIEKNPQTWRTEGVIERSGKHKETGEHSRI